MFSYKYPFQAGTHSIYDIFYIPYHSTHTSYIYVYHTGFFNTHIYIYIYRAHLYHQHHVPSADPRPGTGDHDDVDRRSPGPGLHRRLRHAPRPGASSGFCAAGGNCHGESIEIGNVNCIYNIYIHTFLYIYIYIYINEYNMFKDV